MNTIPQITTLAGSASNDSFTLSLNGITHTYPNNKDGKRQAILDCLSAIPTTAVSQDTYLPAGAALEVVAAVLYPDGIDNDQAYQTAVSTTEKACAHLGYGPEVELGPPAVPFSARGTYRKKYPPLASTLVHGRLEKAGISSTAPRRECACFVIYNEAGFEIYDRHWSLLSDGEQALIQIQVDDIVADADWQKDGEKYVQPLPVNQEYARNRVGKCLRDQEGQPVPLRRVVSEAQKGAYGRVFASNEMSPELEGLVHELLQDHGYDTVIKDGYYQPQPLPMTKAAETAVITHLADLKTEETAYGPALLLADLLILIKTHTQAETISAWQIESVVSEGAVSQALRRLGYETKLTWCQAYDFESQAIQKAQEVLLKEVKVVHDKDKRIGLAKGLTVLAPVITIDSDARTLVYLEMLGHKEAVKANWAALMGGGKSHWVDGVYVSLDGMKEHVKLQTTLPCGWVDHILLHKQASLKEMNPEQPFYLLDDGSQPVPPLFYAMLNKALATPLMPEWAGYLWQNGREARLIELLDEGKGQGFAAWRVKAVPKSWERIVQVGLREQQLGF